jgi:CxxC motif-containing protein (DUF1111 family)
MKLFNRGLTTFAASAALVALTAFAISEKAESQMAVPNAESNRFTPAATRVDPETSATATAASRAATQSAFPEPSGGSTYREAPAAFDNLTNGFDPQGPAFDSLDEDTVVALRSFNDNRFVFEEVEHIADGLGPTYNAQSCRECHQNIVTGGASRSPSTAPGASN